MQMMAGSSGFLELQWAVEALCGAVETDWVLWLALYCMAGAFLWSALSAARLNSLAQLETHLLLAISASAAVVYKARAGPRCATTSFWS